MIKLDRLKIVTRLEYISNINTKVFLTQSQGNVILYYKYLQENPYYLLIQADLKKQELAVEFTGKILLDDYPQLINKTNIRQCFEAINRMSICHLDIEGILSNSEVWKCDVSQDVTCCQLGNAINPLKQFISNHDKWKCTKYGKDGIAIYNTVKTKRYKKRLIIYDKSTELAKATNNDFLKCLANTETVIEYFRDKIRFEINLNTKNLIRNLLNLTDNNLSSVLNSVANPILSVFDEAVNLDGVGFTPTNKKDYLCELVLRDCGYDLEKVEAKMRTLTPKTVSIKRQMQPFRDYFSRIQGKDVPSNIRDLLIH